MKHSAYSTLCFALRFAALLCFLFPAASAFAFDYGVLLSGQYTSEGSDEAETSAVIAFAPWLSLPFNEKAELSLSAGLSADYEDEEWTYIPELLRFDVSFKPISSVSFKAGRIAFQDTSRFTAKGRFDGISGLFDAGSARLNVGFYYTGFLYRDTAKIHASAGDPAAADNGKLDYNNLTDTYFAPRRLIASVQGEFPGLLSLRGNASAGILGQLDLSEADDKLNSQYLFLRYSLGFPGGFDLALAGAAELQDLAQELKPAFAWSAEAGWMIPAKPGGRVSLGYRWASGEGSSTAAYFPLVEEAQGRILKPFFSGMMIAHAAYEVRLLNVLSAELGARYFIRTDDVSFVDSELESDSYFLGGEAFASLLWVPLSDLSFSAGGGAFFPKTGGAFEDRAPLRWQFSIGTIFSF
jgi:hypothetical protein